MNNHRVTVRCGKNTPTPYLKKHVQMLMTGNYRQNLVVDIGCGNGRNIKYLLRQGFINYRAFDMKHDFGEKIILGHDKLPLQTNSVSIILANYVFMFLQQSERFQLIAEINRVAKRHCFLMVELFAAKNSFVKNKKESLNLQQEILKMLRWNKIHYIQERFIACKIF